jgi:hypothetical protein
MIGVHLIFICHFDLCNYFDSQFNLCTHFITHVSDCFSFLFGLVWSNGVD